VKKIVALVSLVLICSTSFSQKAKITGKITNSKTGEPLIGATVTIVSLKRATASDLSGTYTIGGLNAGTYTVLISSISFSKKSIDDVTVKDGEIVFVNIALDEAASAGEEVIVKSTKVNRENANAVLTAQKNSPSVSDGISAEAIRKTPDRNTSDVLKRVSGATLQDNKFAIIRGLSDRYNAAFINGAALPSSESDRKAFAFDIFPSNVLDNLIITKTATPDMPGEFAGGVINITTKSIPSKNFTSISLTTSYNTIATLKEKFDYKGSSTDYIGLDNGARAIPSEIPSQKDFNGLTPAQRSTYSQYFTNNWALTSKKALPYAGIQIVKGYNVQINQKDFLGMLFSLSYNKSQVYSEGERQTIEYDRSAPSGLPIVRANYFDKTYSDQTLIGFLANFSLKINNLNTLSFKNLISINSEDKTIRRNGNPDFDGDPTFLARVNGLVFTSNVIYSSQLAGTHVLGPKKAKIEWLASYSAVKRDIPNLRQNVYFGTVGNPQYTSDVASGATLSQDNGGSMFFSKTDENIYFTKLDYTKPFTIGNSKQNNLKLGVLFQKRERDFDARLLGFSTYNSGSVNFDQSLLTLPEDKIYTKENMGLLAPGRGGFSLVDGSRPSYSYDASSSTTAGYVMLDQRVKTNLRLIYGARVESFNQKLNSFDENAKAVNINTTKTDILPSVNLVYALDTKQNLRFAFSKTVNRPEFRELAPFIFFDFVSRLTVEGDSTLQRTSINNYDVRYEIFPGKAQLFSISGFYKNFQNPIELQLSANANNTAAYRNAKSATLYGVEVEFRTLLATLFAKPDNNILNKLTWTGNAAFMKSAVNIFDKDKATLIDKRDLQGQSPYVFNSSISYDNTETGWSANLAANRAGDRIYIVGNVSDVDLFERGRTVFDFQLAKSFKKDKWDIKLNVKDILAQKQIFYYDVNSDKKFNEQGDVKFSSNTFGRVISINAVYKF
jgi:outer membrane receptor for ferrienterochelin and colicin